HAAFHSGRLPNLARVLGGLELARAVQVPVLAPAPSVTFCSQACLFTGAHPRDHGIPGSEYFDRFGRSNNGVPRHFGFDVGDTLAVDDAVRVFTSGLAARQLQVPTFYERMAASGRPAIVAGNMYARGAEIWLKPSVLELGRVIKGGRLFGMEGSDYDRHVLDGLLRHLRAHGLPDRAIVTMYFLGLDHESHDQGPDVLAEYLSQHVDPMVGELWDALAAAAPGRSIFVGLFSDHGQIAVPPDEAHAIHVGFPTSQALGRFFAAFGLDVLDYPGEDADCNAVATLNGGLAHVYLRNRAGAWCDAPIFARDVLPVARGFWAAERSGRYAPELRGVVSGVLVRNVERDGWEARYEAMAPDGSLLPLADWFERQPAELYADPVHRLDNLAGRLSGDVLLISNYAAGYHFGNAHHGVHGGLHPDDSWATLVYAWPGASETQWDAARCAAVAAIESRCRTEGGRVATTADMLVGLEAVLA
ncbi:MAG TPA: alkaline phosphatase family protein, partial [Lacipirellulaceae bacterium]|nr:alkaline phosphatase family protein [Lacipirellulaceae bacterium]